MAIKTKVLLLLFVLFARTAWSQDTTNSISFSAIESLKVFTPNKYAIQGKIWGGELAYRVNMAANKADYIGLLHVIAIEGVASYRSLTSLTLNHDPSTKGLLGNTFSTIGRVDMQLVQAGPVKLLFTPGFGVVYTTATYFTDKSPLIGSHLNFAAQAGLKIYAGITPALGIQGGADIFHYSDAGARVPNNGINALNMSIGMIGNIDQKAPASSKDPFVYPYKNAFEFGFDFGKRGVFETKDNLYRSGLYTGYSYGINNVFRVKAGFDVGYYFTTYNNNENNATYEGFATSYARLRVSVSAGADINLGRVTVMASYGRYLYFYSYNPIHTYWSPGIKLYLTPWMAMQGKVYIHSNQADYLGLGLLFRVKD